MSEGKKEGEGPVVSGSDRMNWDVQMRQIECEKVTQSDQTYFHPLVVCTFQFLTEPEWETSENENKCVCKNSCIGKNRMQQSSTGEDLTNES